MFFPKKNQSERVRRGQEGGNQGNSSPPINLFLNYRRIFVTFAGQFRNKYNFE
jgi:hypothetical protein